MNKKKKRILKLIQSSDYPLKPKWIAKTLKLNHNTVKVYIRQLFNDNKLIHYDDGGYLTPEHYISESKAVFEPLKIHGLSFHWDYNPKTPPPFLDFTSAVTTLTHRHRKNKAIVDIEEFEGRRVTITNHVTTGKLIISSMATNDPYDYQSFRRYVAWINGRYPRIPNGAWVIKMIGLNWDRKKIGLHGISEITLQTFENMWIKLYQKTKDMVRIESHMVLDISLQEAIEILLDLDRIIEMRYIERR